MANVGGIVENPEMYKYLSGMGKSPSVRKNERRA